MKGNTMVEKEIDPDVLAKEQAVRRAIMVQRVITAAKVTVVVGGLWALTYVGVRHLHSYTTQIDLEAELAKDALRAMFPVE